MNIHDVRAKALNFVTSHDASMQSIDELNNARILSGLGYKLFPTTSCLNYAQQPISCRLHSAHHMLDKS